MNVGICGYGTYIPAYRIKISEIAPVWGKNSADVEGSLGIVEKAIGNGDEDAVTLGFEAAVEALKSSQINPSSIESVLVGSESHPYAVNPTSTILAEFLGVGRNYLASDLEFACKAATTAMISIAGLIAANQIKYGLAVGTDRAQAKPHDILEYSAASASAAYILGKLSVDSLAQIVETSSYSSDTPDFWRRDGVRFPSHGGRFTGEPAYFAHVQGAAKELLTKSKLTASDFSYCVFHMPNGKFPRTVAARLGFTMSQLEPSLTVDKIGNPYSASSLIGLSAVLDVALPGQLIFMVSYGSGAGSDGFVLKVTEGILKKRTLVTPFKEKISHKHYLSYVNYLKNSQKI